MKNVLTLSQYENAFFIVHDYLYSDFHKNRRLESFLQYAFK